MSSSYISLQVFYWECYSLVVLCQHQLQCTTNGSRNKKKIDMIVCVCRNIRESDFESQEQLIERIMQLDHNCGRCQEYCRQLKDQENVCIKQVTQFFIVWQLFLLWYFYQRFKNCCMKQNERCSRRGFDSRRVHHKEINAKESWQSTI